MVQAWETFWKQSPKKGTSKKEKNAKRRTELANQDAESKITSSIADSMEGRKRK